MKSLLISALLLFLSFISFSQDVTFNKLMTYYISKDEELILNDLRQKNYLIQKEQKAETFLFDTQILCIKPAVKSPFITNGVILLKNSQHISAISYLFFDTIQIARKIKEISFRGFKPFFENTTSHWVFEKLDTLVTIEKRNVTVNKTTFHRCEISIVNTSIFQ